MSVMELANDLSIEFGGFPRAERGIFLFFFLFFLFFLFRSTGASN